MVRTPPWTRDGTWCWLTTRFNLLLPGPGLHLKLCQVQNAPLTSGFLPPPQPLILVEDEDVLAKARSLSSFFSPILFINIFHQWIPEHQQNHHRHLFLLTYNIFIIWVIFIVKIRQYRTESTISKMYMVHADDTSTEKLEWWNRRWIFQEVATLTRNILLGNKSRRWLFILTGPSRGACLWQC